jgi:beta-galactosidase
MASACLAQQVPLPPEIENPRVLGVNKEPAHATLLPYPSEAAALTGGGSSFTQSLNGNWQFKRFQSLNRSVDLFTLRFQLHQYQFCVHAQNSPLRPS